MGEYYVSGEYNRFDEHKAFKAELYNKTSYINETGGEISSDGHEYKPEIKKTKKTRSSSNPFKRLIEKMSTAATTVSTTVVSIVTVAVAAVTVCVNVFSPSPRLDVTELNTGADYVEYSVSVDELDEKTEYSLVVENPYHSFEYQVDDSGVYENLVTGLKPNMKYSLLLVGKNNQEKTTFYEEDFYTTNIDTPSAVFDVDLLENAENGTASISYSVYVSDAYNKGNGYVLEMRNGDNLYYKDANLQEGFFVGTSENVPPGETKVRIFCNLDKEWYCVGEYKVNNGITVEKPQEQPPQEPLPEQPPAEEPVVLPDIEILDLTATGVNVFDVSFVVNRKVEAVPKAETLTLYLYLDDKLYDEMRFEDIPFGIVKRAYMDVSEENTTLKVVAVLGSFDENGDPVDIFTAEKSFEIKKTFEASPWIDLENKTTNLKMFGIMPNDAVIVVKDETSGEETEYPIYDEYYQYCINQISWESKQGTVSYSYYVKDSKGTILYEGGSFVADYTVQKSEYSIHFCNPSDVILSYNDDNTMNAYFCTEFTTTDPDLYCELIIDKAYKMKDYIFKVENIPCDTYGLTYTICKEIDGVKYVTLSMTPSGAVGETPYSMPTVDYDGNEVVISLVENMKCDFNNITLVYSTGEKIIVSEEMIVQDSENGVCIINDGYQGEGELIGVWLYLMENKEQYFYDKIIEYVQIKGSLYRLYEFTV